MSESSTSAPAPRLLFRPSEKRGGSDHGWLRTFHTFSFADYYDPRFENFGALRVINEDRVAPSTGFPTHPHREAEIFSYILSGELSHKDSMGHVETMKAGDVQMTSGGRGIRHSEYNDHKKDEVHFLQIWALPYARNLEPKYYTRHYSDADKTDKLAHIVAPASQIEQFGGEDTKEGSGPTPIHASVNSWVSIMSPGLKLDHKLVDRHAPPRDATADAQGKLAYVQVIQTSGYNTKAAPKDGKAGALVKVTINGQEATLGEGDGLFIQDVRVGDNLTLDNVGEKAANLVLFEMDA
jgi:redox-sensitive bicupin YhaK (pirin superfamily)